MKKVVNIDRGIYDAYYDYSYIFSLLCSKDVLSKLEKDYSIGLAKEEELLNCIYNFLLDDYRALINTDSRLETNLNKIIQNSSNTNNECINNIKILLNSCERLKYTNEPFLRMNYLHRKYGDDKIAKKYKDSISTEFLINYKEQIYDSIAFDFRLISACEDLGTSDEHFFDDCLNNYRLFASINYFKLNYPDMFTDLTFVSLIKAMAKFQNSSEQQEFEKNCFFDNIRDENRNLLKYVNKKLRKM